MFGTESAWDFNRTKLRKVRKRIEEGRVSKMRGRPSRKTLNGYVAKIRKSFRFAASRGLVPDSVADELDKVKALDSTMTDARESREVQPAPLDSIERAAQEGGLPPVLSAALRLQFLLACRAGELLSMRPCDVDRSRTLWVFWSTRNKTAK